MGWILYPQREAKRSLIGEVHEQISALYGLSVALDDADEAMKFYSDAH